MIETEDWLLIRKNSNPLFNAWMFWRVINNAHKKSADGKFIKDKKIYFTYVKQNIRADEKLCEDFKAFVCLMVRKGWKPGMYITRKDKTLGFYEDNIVVVKAEDFARIVIENYPETYLLGKTRDYIKHCIEVM